MTFTTIQKKLNRPAQDLCRLIRGTNIGGRKSFSYAEIRKSLFTLEEFNILCHYVEWKKEDYIQSIREFLIAHPFRSYQDITDHIARPASYTWWILTEMSFLESDFAETDKDELFIVNEETERLLRDRGDI